MNRRSFLVVSGLFAAAACAPVPKGRIGPDGNPLPQVYRIKPDMEADIQYRMLDGINTLREVAGAAPLRFDSGLNAAAATHSRDMALQNRPWHFGSDGSSPLDRARRVGFTGSILGENISETYETEMETLAAWLEQEDTRAVVLDRNATLLGFSWYQEPAGKIWWTLVTGKF